MDDRHDEVRGPMTQDDQTNEMEQEMGMEAMSFAMLEDVHPGEIVEGKVVHISSDGVLVDVGSKSEGIIHLQDLSHRHIDRAEEVVQLGDTIRVYVVGFEGEEGALRLSKRRADEQEAWSRLEGLMESETVIEAPVTDVVKGGLVVDVGLRGFVPASHVARGFVSDLDTFLGETIRVRVIEIDRQKRRAILSRKRVLDEEAKSSHDAVWSGIEEGQVRQGTVKSLTDFGAFVDLGGVDGLLHISEMSWGRIKHPSELLNVGDSISVKVLRLDREKEKISLGLRQISQNPWDVVESRYLLDHIYQGKVVRLAGFGAFVELEAGIDGLVHISELADRHIQTPAEAVSVGDTIYVKVLRVDPQHKRISLSKRAADTDIEAGIFQIEVEGPPAAADPPERLNAYHAGDWEDEIEDLSVDDSERS
ncbi:MAG: 30S ribosomal protein S1 [Firmicutes bacterium]|nr:30S ribosomal protein S1 [Bacillota bacterium]MCL5064742.1 30S ribosomal protein S1 [Bacillota bacterium]